MLNFFFRIEFMIRNTNKEENAGVNFLVVFVVALFVFVNLLFNFSNIFSIVARLSSPFEYLESYLSQVCIGDQPK